jgi:hypothetical protein
MRSPKKGQVRMGISQAIIQLFINAVVAEVAPHVTRMDSWRVWDYATLGSYFYTEAQKASIPSCDIIDLGVKTSRAASGYDECDGTEYPSDKALAAVAKIADRFGLAWDYEACEKGWGSFRFYVAEQHERTQAAHRAVHQEKLIARLAEKGEEGLSFGIVCQLVDAGILPRESYVKAAIREDRWSLLTEAEADYYGVPLSDYQRRTLRRKDAA